jgi:cytochrome c553
MNRERIKQWSLRALWLLPLLGAAGFGLVASGIIPITASSGHFAITHWFLNFTKERSVATHSLLLDLPPLDEPALVLKGAGHFHGGCRPCHGAPDLPELPVVPQAMLPPPPDLSRRAADYEPRELFYIVKHGIKLTGMPAWPTQTRDDEVAAVVAFLRVLPGLDAAAYGKLALGDEPRTDALGELADGERPPAAIVASCARCHGYDGNGRGSAAFPKLAGQREAYLLGALEAYTRRERPSGVMQPLAAAVPTQELRALAVYYSRLTARPRQIATRDAALAGQESPSDAELVGRGRAIALEGIFERRVPACADCHGPGPARRSAPAPRLSGQYADYLMLQLQLFSAGTRGGSPHAALMAEVAPRLTHDQMREVAAYYHSLDPARD